MFGSLLPYLVLLIGAVAWNGVVWAVVFRRRREYAAWLRWAHYLIPPLMVVGLVCDVGGMDPDTASMLYVAWLYPAAFLLAAIAGVGALRHDGFRWWLLPAPAWNGLLGLVCLVRYLAYRGVSLGLPGEGLLVGYALAQSVWVTFLYAFFPIFNNLPVLLMPAGKSRRCVRRLNVVPAVVCLLLLVLAVLTQPRGWQIAAGWRRPLAADERPTPGPDFRLGMVLCVRSDHVPTQAHFRAELASLRDLGAQAVNLFVHDNVMTDDALAAALGRFLTEVRRLGLTVILTADYPRAWALAPPPDRDAIVTAMLPFHRFLAERYAPDILVPFIEPYGAFKVITRHTYGPAEWVEMLAAAREAVRQANPAVRCAVYFGQSDDDLALYRQVCRPGAPVDVVGFSLYALYRTREEMEPILAKAHDWIETHGRGREHWLFEFGQSPLTMGGEAAQSHYIQRVLGWATRQPAMKGACVFVLRDYAEKMGLVSSTGRKRLAYHDFRRLAKVGP